MNGESPDSIQGAGRTYAERGIVRRMSMEDLGAVLKIEQSSFPTPWTSHAFATELRDNEYACYFGSACYQLFGTKAL